MVILEGAREERTNEQARARIPMNAAQVRGVIDSMEAETKSKRARIGMAELAIKHGFVTPDAKYVWCEYLARLTA
jgi:hypothetical protein